MSNGSFPIARRRGLNALRACALIGAAVALSGCYSQTAMTAATPTDYRKRHPIEIKEAERTIEIFIGTNRGALTPVQRADVLAFAQSWKREATGGIIVDLPSGTANELAASEAVQEIRSIMSAVGVPPNGINVRPYQPTDPEKLATVRLNYSKIVAEAGPCGLWPHDLGPTSDRVYGENRPYWNLGCSSQRNLAAMVENPADLVQPRGETPPYEARRAVVIDKYKKGEDSSTNYRKPDAGKLSDIGK